MKVLCKYIGQFQIWKACQNLSLIQNVYSGGYYTKSVIFLNGKCGNIVPNYPGCTTCNISIKSTSRNAPVRIKITSKFWNSPGIVLEALGKIRNERIQCGNFG